MKGTKVFTEWNRIGCPSEQQLLELITFGENADRELAEHVDRCSRCQSILDQLTSGNSLADLRSHLESSHVDKESMGPPLRPGDLGSFDEFAIESIEGEGGMAIVYRGWDTRLNREVAIKVLRNGQSDRSIERFRRESRAIGKLAHDHIVPIYKVGTTSKGQVYHVLPLMHGGSLKDRVSQRPISVRESARIASDIALALQCAHDGGLIHRDVKPANILLDASDGRAKLADFGLAISNDEEPGLTNVDVLCGTPEYMSPEQTKQNQSLDGRSDIYSLGITLYECLTGTTPFRGGAFEILEQHRNGNPVPPTRLNRSIPRDLETICLKAMNRDLDRRYSSAKELSLDLNCFLEGKAIAAKPVSMWIRAWCWSRRNRNMVLVLVSLFLSLTLGAILSIRMWLHSEQSAQQARNRAAALASSHDKLKEVVRRFQSRVFSEESLLWDMSSQLRGEMFRDAIAFLDEFGSRDFDKRPYEESQFDETGKEYLQVANAAFQVAQFQESKMAAALALSHLTHALPEKVRSAGDWSMINRSARILLDISLEHILEASDHEKLKWLELARESSQKEIDINPQSVDAIVDMIRTKMIDMRIDPTQSPSEKLNCFRVFWEKLEPFQSMGNGTGSPLPSSFFETIADVGWTLATIDTSVEYDFWFNKVEASLQVYREERGRYQLSFSITDWLRAENLFRKSQSAIEHGEKETATLAMDQCEELLEKVVSHRPQNLKWRRKAAEILAKFAQWHCRNGEQSKARARINRSIQHRVTLLDIDLDPCAWDRKTVESNERLARPFVE